MNDDEIVESLYPQIEWRQPITIARTDGVTRLCCRLCIAHGGMRATELEGVGFETRAEYDQHMATVHPR